MASNPDWPTRPLPRRPRTLWSDLAGLWARFRGLCLPVHVILGIVAALVLWGIASLLFGGGDGNGQRVAARSSTTVRSTLPPTTTTTVALPPGEDRTVRAVLDGDSFELTDGTKVRLIGIDAPDIETNECFSAEATAHLRELLPANRNVRLVYDTSRTDRLGRTLAYVYRLPDGLFVNIALARDGFVFQLTTPPNTAHADQIGVAVAEARNARRGVWQACQTTTTASRPATTAGSGTTAPATTAPGTTTTTADDSSATTSPTTAVGTTTTTAG